MDSATTKYGGCCKAAAGVLLGLAVLAACTVNGGECRGFVYGAKAARRGLADTGGATVFDVTQYGAKADGQTDNAMVGLPNN